MAAAAAAPTLSEINRLINAADSWKDLRKAGTNVTLEAFSNYQPIALDIFGIPINSEGDFDRTIADAEQQINQLHGENMIISFNICTLEYFDHPKSDLVPSLVNAEAVGIQYAVQDCGLKAEDYNPSIKYIVSPGTFLDPAARGRTRNEIVFMEPEQVNLNADIFRQMGGLDSKLITSLEVGQDASWNTFTITMADDLATRLIFKIDRRYNLKEDDPYSKYIKGNTVKNEWFNSNLNVKPVSPVNRLEAKKYVLMKLLGDFLQVVYAKILTENLPDINLNDICIFTGDNVVALRAQLYKVPCVYQNKPLAIHGINHSIYTFKRTAAGALSPSQYVNRFEASKVKTNNNYVKQQLESFIETRIFYNGYSRRQLNDSGVAYIRNLISKIDLVVSKINEISIDMEPNDFRKIVVTYLASHFIHYEGEKIKCMATTTPFKLIDKDDSLNEFKRRFDEHMISNSSEVKNSSIGARKRRFSNLGSGSAAAAAPAPAATAAPPPAPAAPAGASAAAAAPPPAPAAPPAAKRARKRENNGNNNDNNGMKGGYKDCVRKEGDIYYDTPEPKSEEAKYYTNLLETKCPSDAVLESIDSALQNSKVSSSSSAAAVPENIKETIFTIIYPYFKAYGAFTVNKYFYDWVVGTILPNISSDQQFVPYNQFEGRFVEIHNGININNPATYTPMVDKSDSGAESLATAASSRGIFGTVKKGPDGSPFRSSSSSGGPIPITPFPGQQPQSPWTAATGATLTGMSGMSALGIGTPGSASDTPGSAVSMGKAPAPRAASGESGNGSNSPSHPTAKALPFTIPRKGGGNRPRHKTRLRRKSKKIRKYRKTSKLRRNKSTK